jgi:WD40 repeat protein
LTVASREKDFHTTLPAILANQKEQNVQSGYRSQRINAMPAKQLAKSSLSTPSDTYLYTLARTGSDYATIGSDDSLRIFSIPNLNVTRTYASAHKGISCLITAPDGTNLFTAGRDGVIRLWDPRSPSPKPILEIREPKGAGFSALACAGNFPCGWY